MNIIAILFITTLIYGLLVFVNYKAKGKKSLFVRIGTGIFVFGAFASLIWFYGAQIFQSVQLDLNSVSNIKSFIGSKVLGTIALILTYLFVFFKIFYVRIRISNPIKLERKEFLFIIPFVVFDIAVIPCIALLGTTTAIFMYLLFILTGLAFTKLVFCLFKNVNFSKEKLVRL